MTTTPPLSLSSEDQALDLDKEQPLDIFAMPMPMPNAQVITRQQTDQTQNQPIDIGLDLHTDINKQTTNNNPQPIQDNTNDNANSPPIQPLSDLSFGLLTRQKTDNTPHKSDNNNNKNTFTDEQKISVHAFKLSRQVTDDTPHAKQEQSNTFNVPQPHNDNNDNTDEQMHIPASKLSRQITDDTPHNKQEAQYESNAFDMDNLAFNMPPMTITRQQTDDAKNIENENMNENMNENTLDTLDMPLQITRQQTDQTDKDITNKSASPDMTSVHDIVLTPLTRRQTDMAHNVNKIETQSDVKDIAVAPMTETNLKEFNDFNFGAMGLARQQTDVHNNDNNEQKQLIGDDIGGDVFGSLPKIDDISRQTTDMATTLHDEEQTNINMMIDQMDVSNDIIENEHANEEIIKYLPPRVGIENDEKDLTVHNSEINNQYLDENLLMFDSEGKLLDMKKEKLKTETEIETENIIENMSENAGEIQVQQIEDDSCNQFIEHTQPIICMSLNPKKDTEIITAGQDENCYIWDIISYDCSQIQPQPQPQTPTTDHKTADEQKTNDSNNYVRISQHNDTVIDCAYNCTGKFIATASMDNTVKIFNCKRNNKLVSSFDIGNEISYVQWHPNNNNEKQYRNILMAGSFDKNVWMYAYNKKNKSFENIQILCGHSGKIECGGFTKYNNGMNAYSGDDDGMIVIWQNLITENDHFNNFNGSQKYSFKPSKTLGTLYHESGVNVMDDSDTQPLLISGSSDHSVCLINYENGKILQKLGKHFDSVECVQFNKLNHVNNYVSSSSLDGYVKVWDLKNGKIRNELKHNDGVIVHEWFNTQHNSNLIVAGCMDGIVYVWDSRNAKIIQQFKGHQKCSIQAIKITQNDKYIISGADDSIAMVWKL